MRSRLLVLSALVLTAGCAKQIANGPWPTTSEIPVAPSPHPSLAEHVERLGSELDDGFRLLAFGDQRALADGEWQAMNAAIAAREERERPSLPVLAILDTGDIVADGNYADQFAMLADVLSPLRAYPYVVGIGNHEVKNNEPGPSRGHVISFLGNSIGTLPSPADPVELREDRLYYRVDVAGLRLISLDTNDLVYDVDGEGLEDPQPGARGQEQLVWLEQQLADTRGAHTTIVFCHHPFLHSSEKHQGQAQKMWNVEHEGRRLAEMLVQGDVDLVLVGHTHTYERYRLTHESGGSLQVMNVSGRPRNSFLFYGASQRRARDIAGREAGFLAEAGWTGLESWSIEQLDAMVGEESNQFAEIRVTPDAMGGEVFFLDDEAEHGIRNGGSFLID